MIQGRIQRGFAGLRISFSFGNAGPFFWKKRKRKYDKTSSSEMFTQHDKR